jgi:hypothetical protein
MRRARIFALVLTLTLAVSIVSGARADAVGDLSNYSVFSQVDLSSLAGGRVMTARGPAMGFPRDLSVQAVYLVHAPVSRALAMHVQWDATRHPELKVYAHHDFSTHPTLADFAQSIPNNSAVRRLADATEKLPDAGDLQLSKGEAGMFKRTGGFRDFWSELLYHRALGFLGRGLAGLPPYDSADGSARVGNEVSRLLREQPKVSAAFAPIIQASCLSGGPGSAPVGPYWELFDVEGEGAFSLGAASSVETSGGAAQLLDMQYYGSGGYYVYITLYQMWPVTVNGESATLVWRVDSISSLSLSDLGPFDLMGSGAAMMKDIQRIVNFFQRDIGGR